jgi:hypothetical protein
VLSTQRALHRHKTSGSTRLLPSGLLHRTHPAALQPWLAGNNFDCNLASNARPQAPSSRRHTHPWRQWRVVCLLVTVWLRQLHARHGQALEGHVIIQATQRLTTPPDAGMYGHTCVMHTLFQLSTTHDTHPCAVRITHSQLASQTLECRRERVGWWCMVCCTADSCGPHDLPVVGCASGACFSVAHNWMHAWSSSTLQLPDTHLLSMSNSRRLCPAPTARLSPCSSAPRLDRRLATAPAKRRSPPTGVISRWYTGADSCSHTRHTTRHQTCSTKY